MNTDSEFATDVEMSSGRLLSANRQSTFKRYARRVFSCDYRSLALLRMALGVLVLVDLAMRSTSIMHMYSDQGFFTRELANLYYRSTRGLESFSYWSIHKLSGAVEFQIFLFVVTAIVATLFLVGWKTRISSIFLWVLVASMQARNPLVNTSGDMLLKMLLFWSMFLPLGAVWSIDSKRIPAKVPKRIANFATAGIILQLCFMYWFTGVAKCNAIWFRGEALDYVLNLDIYARGLADTFLQFPFLLKLASWFTVYGELALPTLLLLPWLNTYWRWLNIAMYWTLHLLIFASLSIGLFSFISMAGWLPLFPSSFWKWPGIRQLASFFDWLYAPSKDRTQRASWNWRFARRFVVGVRGARWLQQTVAAICIVFFLFWNLANIDERYLPKPLVLAGIGLNLNQHFQMFGVPPQHNPWFVYDATLADGSKVDVMRNKPIDYSRPPSARKTLPTFHWRKLHRNLVMPYYSEFRRPLAEYVAHHWNRNHGQDKQIVYMKVTCFLDELNPRSSEGDQITQTWGQYGKPRFDQLLEGPLDGDMPLGF